MSEGKAAIQISGYCFAVTGYIEHVAGSLIYDAPTDHNDLTDSQAALLHGCVRDAEMQSLARRVLERAGEIEVELGLAKARPWAGLEEILAGFNAGTTPV